MKQKEKRNKNLCEKLSVKNRQTDIEKQKYLNTWKPNKYKKILQKRPKKKSEEPEYMQSALVSLFVVYQQY